VANPIPRPHVLEVVCGLYTPYMLKTKKNVYFRVKLIIKRINHPEYTRVGIAKMTIQIDKVHVAKCNE